MVSDKVLIQRARDLAHTEAGKSPAFHRHGAVLMGMTGKLRGHVIVSAHNGATVGKVNGARQRELHEPP